MRNENAIYKKWEVLKVFLEKRLLPQEEKQYWEGYKNGLEFALFRDGEL